MPSYDMRGGYRYEEEDIWSEPIEEYDAGLKSDCIILEIFR